MRVIISCQRGQTRSWRSSRTFGDGEEKDSASHSRLHCCIACLQFALCLQCAGRAQRTRSVNPDCFKSFSPVASVCCVRGPPTAGADVFVVSRRCWSRVPSFSEDHTLPKKIFHAGPSANCTSSTAIRVSITVIHRRVGTHPGWGEAVFVDGEVPRMESRF